MKVNNHPAKFGGHRHRGKGDTMVLVCHVFSQDRAAKKLSNVMGRSPSKIISRLPSLVAISTAVVEIQWL